MKRTEKRYQVELQTLGSGWINTWVEEDDLGEVKPQTFGSRAEARAALDEFLADVRSAVEAGAMADIYRRKDFRIRLVGDDGCP